MVREFYKDKRVLITGHSGFKGSWLSEMLLEFESDIIGISNQVCGNSMFKAISLEKRIDHRLLDVRNAVAVESVIEELQPDIVFHLAAQPIVRLSYRNPLETIETNIIGTGNILNALRTVRKPCACVVVTSDKCYENKEWCFGYRETDPLGGHDPYSASKGCAELLVSSWRRSFFSGSSIGITSARSGNVIGGGDWTKDRVIPDCIRSLKSSKPIEIRNPNSTRPWQHVLEPLYGYAILAMKLYMALKVENSELISIYSSAFNFGPKRESNCTVRSLVERVLKNWSGQYIEIVNHQNPHEAHLLNLSTEKAETFLNWKPVWNLDQTINKTIEWYQEEDRRGVEFLKEITQEQIRSYLQEVPYSE